MPFNILNIQCPMLNTVACHVMIMANTYTNSFIHNIGLNEENSLSHLLEKISPEIENETDLIEHSKYYNDVDFKNLLHNAKSKISMLSLNCQSINAKFDKLKLFLDDVSTKHRAPNICYMYSGIMGSRGNGNVILFSTKLLNGV